MISLSVLSFFLWQGKKMARKIDWERQIGRRLKLRDLHIFLAVMQRGSLSGAAAQLGVSQPAISEVIAGLENTLGVRLFDRSTRGVEPTMYGNALFKRGTVVFDELRQTVRDIEFLADPTVGELRIGCPESLVASILLPVMQRFSAQYPKVVLHVSYVVSPPGNLPELRERTFDVVLDRLVPPLTSDSEDFNIDVLFEDFVVVAAGTQSPWARRRKIDLAELINEPWILPPPGSWNYTTIAEAFRARDLSMPRVSVVTYSVHARTDLLSTGRFITAFPSSFLRINAEKYPLKVLQIELPAQPWPVAIVTLKNRTLSPVVQLFIDHLRAFTREMAPEPKPEKKSA
jgi:DNA-binding transcriptional LysR family regulator